MSKSWKKGGSRGWRRLKAQVIARDGGACQLKIPDVCQRKATTAHHTAGKTVTGDNPAYLVAACQPCNLKVGDPRKHDPDPKPWAGWG